jgi:hypothetical protein
VSAKRLAIALVLLWLLHQACSPRALADGGTLRASLRRGGYQVTVFTAPAVLCAGQIDLSVLVQDARTGKPITEMPVVVRASRADRRPGEIEAEATTRDATNKLLRAARLELPEPGRWHIEVSIGEIDPSQPVTFDVEVASTPPRWRQMIPWIAWPILPIGLYAIAQFRPRRAWRGRAA